MKNFKLITILLCLFAGITVSAQQEYELNLETELKKTVNTIDKGESFIIKKVVHRKDPNGNDTYYFYDNKNNTIVNALGINTGNKFLGKLNETFNFKYKTVQSLWNIGILDEVIPHLTKSGSQIELRREGERETFDYLEKIKEYGLEFNDPYLKDYIYSLILKIAPEVYVDGRRTNLNVFLFQNPEIKASVFPNGTIVINTGLLAALHTEDELVAILAHEIAHFVFDHSIANVNKAISRKKREEFWSSLATGISAATEIGLSVTSDYYTPGLLTMGTLALTSEISSKVIDHLGIRFDKEQENKADEYALKVLEILGYNKNALSTALNRAVFQHMAERSNFMFVDHDNNVNLVGRIKRNGSVETMNDLSYEQKISFAITNMAYIKYADKHFTNSMSFSSLNIKNGVATSDDYVLKARCLLATKNTVESNKEVADLIEKAKELNPGDINAYKTEIILIMRLNDYAKAYNLLENYINLVTLRDEKITEEAVKYFNEERIWAERMLVKLKGMMGSTAKTV